MDSVGLAPCWVLNIYRELTVAENVNYEVTDTAAMLNLQCYVSRDNVVICSAREYVVI